MDRFESIGGSYNGHGRYQPRNSVPTWVNNKLVNVSPQFLDMAARTIQFMKMMVLQ